VIEVTDLTVSFGGVKPLRDVSLSLPGGTCGLIGPNGAGKTTFFNVMSGFVAPASGRVRAFGEDLLSIGCYQRARWGLRRTFQTEQAITGLSIYDNVVMVVERSAGRRSNRRQAVMRALEFVGLQVAPSTRVEILNARERRLVELARAVVGRPRIVLLDEPAAGLAAEETEELCDVVRRIPEEYGAMTVLVDHDMSLVSACCSVTAVLDFGTLIAIGPTAEVLHDESVIRAYLGTEEQL
jgi:branched-chain amino acid transport system ATP-binding protein